MLTSRSIAVALTLALAVSTTGSSAGRSSSSTSDDGIPVQDLSRRGVQDANQCRQKWGDGSPNAQCTTAYLNSVQDFCLFAPRRRDTIGNAEENVVSYCTKTGFGTRALPADAIHSAQFIKTSEYIQVVGLGDFTKINVQAGDDGGELDPYGPKLLGNPHNSKIYTRAWTGDFEEVKEWHMYMGATEYSFRICKNQTSKDGKRYCDNRYDEQGAQWNDPGRYENGVFEACDADTGEAPGWYGNWRWEQGKGKAPGAHPPPKTYNCRTFNGIHNGKAIKIPS